MPGSSRYALIGAAGYVAPRHMDAIARTGGVLEAACDIADSVGILDRHFPKALFFTEFDHFADHVRGRTGGPGSIDRVAICTPNHLHKTHAAFALRAGADAVCEKPVALDPAELDELANLERETGRRVSAILQLRLHPAIVALRERVAGTNAVHDVELTYVTARGPWYHASWKGDEKRSGGIAANIGIHFFDVLTFVFGPVRDSVVHHRTADRAAGWLELERARVRWFLSLKREDLAGANVTALRCMDVDGLGQFDFSNGFEDLHVASYREIEAGRGFGLADARPAIEITAGIRTAPVDPGRGGAHALADRLHAETEAGAIPA